MKLITMAGTKELRCREGINRDDQESSLAKGT
jgi:hypothetical protein